MATLYHLRVLTRLKLAESSQGRFSDELLNRSIEEGARQFSILSGCLLTLDKSITTAAGIYTYDLPAKCPGPESIIGVWWGDENHLKPTSLTALLRLGFNPDDTSDTADPEKWYCISDTGVQHLCLYPTPGSAENVRLWHGIAATPFVTDSSVCDVPDTWKWGVVNFAVELVFETVREFGYAAEFHERAMQDVGRARAFVEATIAAGLQDRDGTNENNMGMF
jgi:hypothetical protein